VSIAHGTPARVLWHPVTIAAAIGAVSVTIGALHLGRTGGGLSLWLVMGAAAGFATSGSV